MKKLWALVCALAVAGCVVSGNYAIRYRQNIKNGQNINQDIQDLAKKKKTSLLPKFTVTVYAEDAVAAEENEESETSGQTGEIPENPIDFEAIQAINEDIYAWITVPGTNVDYPIVQDPENDAFYLDHGPNRESSVSGSIYTEKRNLKDFMDFNTILYGHNMKDGSMFASLHRFHDRKFFDDNRDIWVYTPEHVLHYDIFAAYKYDNRHILYYWNFERKDLLAAAEEQKAVEAEAGADEPSAELIAMLEELKGKQDIQKKGYLKELYDTRAMDAFVMDDPIVKPTDKIITLSTCINDANYRYLVQGVLTEIDGKPFDPEKDEELYRTPLESINKEIVQNY